MSAQQIAHALRGKPNGAGWLVRCPCPNHGRGRGDRNPSLSIGEADDKLLLCCFAGCEFDEIMDSLRGRGLLEDRRTERQDPRPRHVRTCPKPEPDELAIELWQRSEPIEGTIAEEYLQRRGILLTPPCLRHDRGSMIAAVHQPHAGITAIQKTPIRANFSRGDRMTKGPLGSGAVRLGAAQEIMGIAEGTETALSAMMLAGMSVWASLGGKRLHSVELPSLVREVHIFADNDDPGREAAERARDAQRDLGRTVKIRRPPPEFKDYNDFIIADADAWQRDLP